jgi:Flp pilus assembly protein TadB
VSGTSQPSRATAITMLVVVVLAFVAILVGLAIGQVALAGAAGVVLVIVWFVLRSIQKRGARS